MLQLKMQKNKENLFKYFILILFVPIVGVAILFYYSFQYVQNKIDFINHQVVGIKQVKNVDKTISILDEYRHLLYSQEKNNPLLISKMNNKLEDHLLQFQRSLKSRKHTDCVIPDDIRNIIANLQYSTKKGFTPQQLTFKIEEMISILKNISYASNLILDPNLDTYLLIHLTLFTLPELKEQSSIMRNCEFLSDDIDTIVIKISKLEQSLKNFQFDTSKLHKNNTNRENIINIHSQLIEEYEKMLTSNILKRNESTKQLEEYGNDLLNSYYTNSYKRLSKLLAKSLESKREILSYIILFALGALFFLIYINNLFYNKNKEFIEKIEKLSVIDSMTNLYNRRHFDTLFPIKQKTQKRREKSLIFMMIDIDNFKRYNDTYGHDAGDRVISSVASKLKNSLHRSTDTASRLGGEEFGILLEDMTKSQSINFANKLLHAIEDMHIIHEKNLASNFVTTSIGLSVIPPDTQYDMKKIYQLTDKALYHSKENGRNQVTFCKTISEE
jgi:diguanylate cyclase (GGDEF)-like protein